MARPIRLAYLASHPIQYQAPLLKRIAREPGITFKAFFCSDFSIRGYADREFGRRVEWDVPLLDGYEYEFLPGVLQEGEINFGRPFNWGLVQRLEEGRFDALWVHGWGHLTHIRAIAAANRLGIPVFIRGESNLHLASSGGLRGMIKPAFLRWLFSHIAGFLAIGSWNREFYLAHGVPASRITMMPYAVDNGFFQARAEAAISRIGETKRALGLDPTRPVILYASKLTERKRALDLLSAYARLSPDGREEPRPYLLIIGDGELRPEFEARMTALGWDSIRMLGFKNQTELPDWYALCDIFVLPSFNEPWGLVVNEVMNAGKMVIVSDQVGSGADLVRPGENGYIFPAGDVEALASSLARAQDHERFREMGRRSAEIIQSWGFEADVVGLQEIFGRLGMGR